jgi:glutamyl-tRNA synthetase
MLHIGGVRTALYAWLIARRTGGQFILRIEDTDQGRYDERAEQSIKDSLLWLGLEWDEGPDVGGPYGPYVQSQRLERYGEVARQLVESGFAYYDDTTPEELEELRVRQKAAGQAPGYDNRGRFKTKEDIEKSRAGGKPVVVRLKVPDNRKIKFDDTVRGEVEFDLSLLQDFIILKADGFPTYHLAHVVDDYDMKVTHVIRAEEWIPSTPRHVLIHEALGWETPVYVHVPQVLGKDKAKLSKRHGAASALEYRDQGFLPEAVFNFLALLGWSPGDDTEVMSRDEIISKFTLERILPSPAVFDMDKLTWLNGVHIRQLPVADLLERVMPFLERPEADGGLPDSVARPLDRSFVESLLPLVHERLKTLAEAAATLGFFFADDVRPNPADIPGRNSDPQKAIETLNASLELLKSAEPFEAGPLEEKFRALAESLGTKPGPMFTPVRVSVTGTTMAPPLFETIVAIGRERCVERIERAIKLLQAETARA